MLIRKKLKSKELIIAFIANNENHLTPVELNKCKYAQNSSRYFDWLRGRSALKKIITSLNKDLDVTKISFPHPFLSLSHTKDCAVAIGILNSGNAVKGIGIDLELDRKVSIKHMKFYLNDFESDFGLEMGRYEDDWYFAGTGNLDQCNGAYDINGDYGYYITVKYPFTPPCTFGVREPSFSKQSPSLP